MAMKPFCSGGRGDAGILHDLQGGDLTLEEINPYYFGAPLAPLVAARLSKRKIPLQTVLDDVHQAICRLRRLHGSPPLRRSSSPASFRSPFLLIEGAGGLLAPLGEPGLQSGTSRSRVKRSKPYNALDLIQAITAKEGRSCSIDVIVVGANRLGTLSHTLLTVAALKKAGIKSLAVVLMNLEARVARSNNKAARTNPAILAELLHPVPIVSLPFLGKEDGVSAAMRNPRGKITALLRVIAANRRLN
jgi:dethiobiotin synthase